MSETQSRKAKARWDRGEGSGFEKGNELWDNKNSEKTRFRKGIIPWITGRKAPWAKNLPQAFTKGNKHPNWRGGISPESYGIDWTETLRRSIRERDKYVCRLCGKQQGDRAFCVHHIDYDKNNCRPDNLITLCSRCHSKTNSNRKLWIKKLQNLTK